MNNVKPRINVTPLIDVLLVLVIIFMVISPSKFSDFKAKIPDAPRDNPGIPNPQTLIVSLEDDSSLRLNRENAGNIGATENLTARLTAIFRQREAAGAVNAAGAAEKTVFIKSSRKTPYGEVVKVVDAVKSAGANPIALQIDDLR